jgi:DNA-binding response OmpR family regulator
MNAMEATRSNLRILIVDDDPGVLHYLARTVRLMGHESVLAKDGLQARDLLLSTEFDMIVCDFILPGFDGRELLQWYRWQGKKTFFILISGYFNESFEDDFKALGVDLILPKPIESATLQATIEKFLKTYRPVEPARQEKMPAVELAQSIQPAVEEKDEFLEKLLTNIPGAVAAAEIYVETRSVKCSKTEYCPAGIENMMIECSRTMTVKETLIKELYGAEEQIEQVFFATGRYAVFTKMLPKKETAVSVVVRQEELNLGLTRLMFGSHVRS